MNEQHALFNMVEQQIRTWQVLDAHVLETLKTLKRELFVPPIYKSLAYSDLELPLGEGEIMLSPKVQARLFHDLAPQKTEQILEVGCGSGYLTALLAQHGQKVIGMELHASLAELARENLARAQVNNVDILHLDASQAEHFKQDFDAILLTGSCEQAPEHLLNKLKLGGRLLGVFGHEPIMQATLITRMSVNEWHSKALWDTVCPRLHGFEEPSKFKF